MLKSACSACCLSSSALAPGCCKTIVTICLGRGVVSLAAQLSLKHAQLPGNLSPVTHAKSSLIFFFLHMFLESLHGPSTLSLLGVSSLYLLDFRAEAALRLLLLNAFACLEGVTGLFPGDSLLWMWLSSRSSIEF